MPTVFTGKGGGRWKRGLHGEGTGTWRSSPHTHKAEGTVQPRTGKDGGCCGRRKDKRTERRVWKVEGEGHDFRGAVGVGKEGRQKETVRGRTQAQGR